MKNLALMTLILICTRSTVQAESVAIPPSPHVSQSPESDPLAKLAVVSEKYVGVPYKTGPLGEGKESKINNLPLWREDLFDCTTYLETVMAQTYAKNPEDMECLIKRIRYKDGQVSYRHRLHLPDSDWKVEQERNGILKDVTDDIVGGKTLTIIGASDRGAWLKGQSKGIVQADATDAEKLKIVADLKKPRRYWKDLAEYRKKEVQLKVAPVDALLTDQSLLDKIPSGTIFNVVRRSNDWVIRGKVHKVPTMISHQGILIRKNGELFVRHASIIKPTGDTGPSRVIEMPLKEYLLDARKNLVDPGTGQQNVMGLNLMALQPRPKELCN